MTGSDLTGIIRLLLVAIVLLTLAIIGLGFLLYLRMTGA